MKPWLDTWRYRHDPNEGHIAADDDRCVATLGYESTEEDEGMLAAAPEMCRALLIIEHGSYGACTYCGRRQKHDGGCWVDTALMKAGLPDQKSRDAARKEMEK